MAEGDAVESHLAHRNEAPSRKPVALSTLVLTKDYEIGATVLCSSIDRAVLKRTLGDIEAQVVAFLPSDYKERKINTTLLEGCYDRLIALEPVSVSRGPSYYRLKEQYIKLRFWSLDQFAFVLYMDADFLVTNTEALAKPLIREPSHDLPTYLGAVRDWWNGGYASWFNRGFLVLEPHPVVYKYLLESLEPAIAANKFNTNMAEQGYLSYHFYPPSFNESLSMVQFETLPTTYNANIAIYLERPDVWKSISQSIIAIHYTLIKPWTKISVELEAENPVVLWQAAYQKCLEVGLF